MDAISRRALAALALACACASAGPPPPAPGPGTAEIPADLPRSSIGALLTHRAELALDAAQVQRLEQLDRERERQDADVRAQRGPGARADRERLEGPVPGRSRRPVEPGALEGDVQRQLDENDVRAFLAAEQALRPEQRERARHIAERYRETRSDGP